MKKLVLVCLVLGLLLVGCTSSGADVEQMFRSDTVVNIPLHPEETAAQTEEPTEEETSEPAQPPTEKSAAASSGGSASSQNSGSKSSGSKSSGSKTSAASSAGTKTAAEATQAPETQSAETEPAQTEPPETKPLETDPPETEPPQTEPPVAAAYDISGYAVGSLEYAVAEQINAYRTEAGLGSLSMDGYLSGVASVRAYEVSLSWSHTRPDGSGWQTVLLDYGVGYSAAAEELVHSAGFDAAAIVSKWMASDANSADLLNPAYTTVGVGVYSANGTTFLATVLIG